MMNKERPILFSGPMVRAILEGRKTQTRRVIKSEIPNGAHGPANSVVFNIPDDAWRWWSWGQGLFPGGCVLGKPFKCPQGKPGTRLWVRENAFYWGRWKESGKTILGKQKWKSILDKNGPIFYQASEDIRQDVSILKRGRKSKGWIFRPAMFMPRWASRIKLEILDIRVQKLQDISENDAKAEGVGGPEEPYRGDGPHTFKEFFQETWDIINRKRGFGWNTNPWVFAINFKRIE